VTRSVVVAQRVLMSKRVAMRFLDQSARPIETVVAVHTGDTRQFVLAVRRSADLRSALNRGDIVHHSNATNILFTGSDDRLLVGVFRVACDLNFQAEIVGHGDSR
jgi:hypothetical protein